MAQGRASQATFRATALVRSLGPPTVARYRTSTGTWRVTGSTSLIAGQRVTIVLGANAQGKTIGSATVDAAGAFSIRAGALPDPRTPAQTLVTVISGTGGVASFPLTITT